MSPDITEVILGPEVARAWRHMDAATQKYLADYRADPPAGSTAASTDAYCKGFTECFEMMLAIITMRVAK
jgi:hypothetical protein